MVASDFFNRVAAYPLVTSAYQQASSGLAWATDRSAYAKSAAGMAENGMRRVAGSAAPLLAKYEQRVSQLDGLACRQLLDRLESACPTVLQPTEEVVERGRGYYSTAVKPKVDFVLSPVSAAVATAGSMKSASLQSYRRAVASRAGQAGLRRFDHLVRLFGQAADRCLPPTEEEMAAAAAAAEEAEKQKRKRRQRKQRKQEKQQSEDQSQEADDEKETETEADDEDDRLGDEEKAVAADPAQSLALAYELGRRLGLRATDRLAGQAGRLSAAGHRLLDWLLGRDSSTASSAASTASPTSKSADKGTATRTDDDEGAESDSELDRSDMSTD